jgi:hypothetical protein
MLVLRPNIITEAAGTNVRQIQKAGDGDVLMLVLAMRQSSNNRVST